MPIKKPENKTVKSKVIPGTKILYPEKPQNIDGFSQQHWCIAEGLALGMSDKDAYYRAEYEGNNPAITVGNLKKKPAFMELVDKLKWSIKLERGRQLVRREYNFAEGTLEDFLDLRAEVFQRLAAKEISASDAKEMSDQLIKAEELRGFRTKNGVPTANRLTINYNNFGRKELMAEIEKEQKEIELYTEKLINEEKRGLK